MSKKKNGKEPVAVVDGTEDFLSPVYNVKRVPIDEAVANDLLGLGVGFING